MRCSAAIRASPLDEHPAVQAGAGRTRPARSCDLSYTVIRAPADGVVTKVEQLQVGDYINAATPVFSLISSRDVWVEANFKEDDLTYMRRRSVGRGAHRCLSGPPLQGPGGEL